MTKLRIGLAMQGGTGWMGGTEYVKNLILACGHLPAEERNLIELCLISEKPLDAALAGELEPHLSRHYVLTGHLPPKTMPNRIRWLWDRQCRGLLNSRFAEFVRSEQLDFLYPLTYDNQYNIQVTLPIGGAFGSCRWAGWIPDFQHRYMPRLFNSWDIEKRDAGIASLAADAKLIVFSSESAAADFRRFYPSSPAAVEVLHFYTHPNDAWFVGDPAVIQRQFHLPDKYLLVSNQFWQHKNHRVIFEALALLRAKGIQPEVVCTGFPHDSRDKDYFNSILRVMHETGIASQVHILGLIERKEQIQLMRRSLAVLQPSLFEGWSTVVEDARCLGRPIIMSDIAVHCEQRPDGGGYFQHDSAESLASVLAQWWGSYPAGPDLPREAAARDAGLAAAQNYARKFIEIARGRDAK